MSDIEQSIAAMTRAVIAQIAQEEGVSEESVIPLTTASWEKARKHMELMRQQGVVPLFTRAERDEGIEICPGVRILISK